MGLNYPRSLPPNILAIGPVFRKDYPKMNSDLSTALNALHSKKRNVVYVSFGSVVSGQKDLAAKIMAGIQDFLLNTTDTAVLWSTTGLEMSQVKVHEKIKDRLLMRSWVSQRAVLDHPAIKLFFTHG
jgi:UDP:flavonoid glycosyltransferase YjiC (YdhE family)